MLKVHVHVHETEFRAQNICLSHSSTKDPGNVSRHALASALRLSTRLRALPCVFTVLKNWILRFMYMYMNFTALNIDAW